ncbi:hypothetical protein EG19_00560 [Thermoanaerobaculum aquaticum]|uniref:Uncharacterized protein n=1 Tax=Thermoanaerobaculum aquaticum TaxID=1312852 RepID=A0A062XXF0_9BACT|nr:hypothetical protein [Thermoanaerobaculum aquaticum]KDA54094.1 hypothetical protein EG19_00560 [Thermoanaerobaculum aquaticum]BCW92127.1 MAG: hypothetical protein KatS3mg007_0021 [Thermoanaerobaculum sp.]GBC80409.1 hypothetical protein HRbin09_01646 [bacterium HR09]
MVEEVGLQTQCPKCGELRPSWSVRECPICGKFSCMRCGVWQYGRLFCSPHCAAFFFHGDPEETPEEG